MAKKNSAVLWTVGQSLEKGDKEQARHNMGISFESSTTLTTKTLTFVDNIKENATTGDLTFTKNTVLVDNAVSSTSNNPVSGNAVSTAISNIEFMKTGTTDPNTTPTKRGIHYRNTVTGDVWIATGTSSASDWKLLSDRIHVLMNQYKYISISGVGSSIAILCDKFNYTIDANNGLVFTPVSPEQAYIWVNRGDFIVFDSCVATDPWGDSYWMQQVEVQSDTTHKEVTNFAFDRVYLGELFNTWFNTIIDENTNIKYFTNYDSITKTKIESGHLKFKFGNNYDVSDTGFNANSSTDVTYEMPLAGNKYGITKLLKYPNPAPSDWNTFYDSNDTAVTPTYVSHYVESNFFRKRDANNPTWDAILQPSSEAAFWFVTNSASPTSSNKSPESGALYMISGGGLVSDTTNYRTQLVMGDHLYYRHTTGSNNAAWSDWFMPIGAYLETSNSIHTIEDIKICNNIVDAFPITVKRHDSNSYTDLRLAGVFRPDSASQDGYVLTAKYNTVTNEGYFQWEPVSASASIIYSSASSPSTGTPYDTLHLIDNGHVCINNSGSNELDVGLLVPNGTSQQDDCVLVGDWNSTTNKFKGTWEPVAPNARQAEFASHIGHKTDSNHSIGSTEQPVYVDSYGVVRACQYKIVVGTPAGDPYTIYFY